MAGRMNRRAIARIEAAADRRAKAISTFILRRIHEYAPRDDLHHDASTQHLADSYYAVRDRAGGGDWLIKSRSRYWAFVEFGTAQHGDAQPHVRPAIDDARAEFGR